MTLASTDSRASRRAQQSNKKAKGPRLGYKINEWSQMTGTSRATTRRLIACGYLKIIPYGGGRIPLIPHSEAIRLGFDKS